MDQSCTSKECREIHVKKRNVFAGFARGVCIKGVNPRKDALEKFMLNQKLLKGSEVLRDIETQQRNIKKHNNGWCERIYSARRVV